MVPSSSYWHPVVVYSDENAHLTTPPLGMPDPRCLKDITNRTLRPRIYLSPQIGPTCLFFAACRISPIMSFQQTIGQFEQEQARVALFFAIIASLKDLFSMPIPEELKEGVFYTTMANAGLFFFFQERFFQKLRYDFFSYPEKMGYLMRLDEAALRKKYTEMIDEAKRFGVYVLHKICTEKMGLFIHAWEPIWGLSSLIPVLKTHLYFLAIGKFGLPFFQNLYKVEDHAELGCVLSGRLRPCYEKGKMRLNHAIVVIGIRMFAKYRGWVYFIDPNDGSGPSSKQPVYRIKAIDFLRRLADVDGGHLSNPFLKRGRFIWVGNPSLFLC
jgi:hypothetical protein